MLFSQRFLRKINCFIKELSTISQPLSISLMSRSNRKNPEGEKTQKTEGQLSSYYRARGISLSLRKLKDNCTFRFFIHSRYLKIVVSLGPEKICDRVAADSDRFAKSFLI